MVELREPECKTELVSGAGSWARKMDVCVGIRVTDECRKVDRCPSHAVCYMVDTWQYSLNTLLGYWRETQIAIGLSLFIIIGLCMPHHPKTKYIRKEKKDGTNKLLGSLRRYKSLEHMEGDVDKHIASLWRQIIVLDAPFFWITSLRRISSYITLLESVSWVWLLTLTVLIIIYNRATTLTDRYSWHLHYYLYSHVNKLNPPRLQSLCLPNWRVFFSIFFRIENHLII